MEDSSATDRIYKWLKANKRLISDTNIEQNASLRPQDNVKCHCEIFKNVQDDLSQKLKDRVHQCQESNRKDAYIRELEAKVMLHWNALEDKEIRRLDYHQFFRELGTKMLELDGRFEYLRELEAQHKDLNPARVFEVDLKETIRKDAYILELEANLHEDYKKIQRMSSASCMICQ